MDLEALLVEEGVAAPRDHIRAVLAAAEREARHPIAALVEEGIVAEDVLADLLARACSSIVVDLDRADPEPEVIQLLSWATARELLVVPLSRSAGKLRVAFGNPLDEEAVRLIESVGGAPVVRLVGTLSGLRDAIERAYGARPTRLVPAPPSEMPPEITRKVDARDTGKDTSPLHRLEEEATPEQRHEALLLALIERGLLTRADYVEALKRLLSGRA
jgi:hypothetical protein